jgi:8-oxo-dGTP pyrophosphatase MutT (NUDIX family)
LKPPCQRRKEEYHAPRLEPDLGQASATPSMYNVSMSSREAEEKALEEKLGRPVVCSWEYEIAPWEYEVVDGSMYDGRAHDVTFFIRKSDDPLKVAVVSKPFFPSGAFRVPSGAATSSETLEQGAIREAHEETGLDVELTRYVARIEARFTSGERKPIRWTTHIFEAREVGGKLEPTDTVEIAEARWATLDELQGPIRQVLIDAGWDLFRYRVALTDLTVEALTEIT